MHLNFLDFEKPIAELEAKIEELRRVGNDTEVNIVDEISKLENKSKDLTRKIFSSLSSQQVVKLARHPQRPHPMDYFNKIFTDFDELFGDRHFSAGHTVIGGLARLDGEPVMIIGQQKGRSTKEKIKRNFGMPKPEDYRKALRLMKMAEKFHLPVISFIDTPGAYPGIGAEERNQSEAIAKNLFELSTLRTPVLVIVTGEGGSGGALAMGVGDRIIMMQYSIYSVISPEGCASILWRSAEKAGDAADAMGVTPDRIIKLGLIDQIVDEPLGGAHRDADEMAARLKKTIQENLRTILSKPIEKVLDERYQRLMGYGL